MFDKTGFHEIDDPGPVTLKTGKRYAFADGVGEALVQGRLSKGSRAYWAKVDRPGNSNHGHRVPFYWNGRYGGAVVWMLPDLVREKEDEVVDVDFVL